MREQKAVSAAVAGWHELVNRVSLAARTAMERHAARVSSESGFQPVTPGQIHQSVSRTIKGGLVLAGLFVLQGLLFIFLGTRQYRFNTYDWLALIIKAGIAGIAISLYKPATLLVSAPVVSFVQSDRRPGWRPYRGNLVALAKNLTLLALLTFLCVLLLPKIAKFNHRILHAEWLTVVLLAAVFLAVVGILLLMGLNARPFFDLLSGKIASKVAPAAAPAIPPSTTAGRACPKCREQNDNEALFCAACGSSIPPLASPPPPPQNGAAAVAPQKMRWNPSSASVVDTLCNAGRSGNGG